MRRAPIVLALFVLGAVAHQAAGWSLGGPPAPRFAVIPAATAREGQGHLSSLQDNAAAEGFLDRVLGTNCFSQAVNDLTSDCRRLGQEAKTRLALSLTNCQLAVQGGQTYPCHRRASLKECTEALPDRAHALFVEFLTHTDTMCLFIQNQNFERYTENMLNRLAEGAGFAKEQLAAVAKTTGALAGDTAALASKAEAALGMLRQHAELEEESLRLQKRMRAEAAAYFQSLDAKQQLGLELQDAALAKQAALEAGQAAALAQLAEARLAVGGVFDLVEGRAAELAAVAGAQADAQRALAGELSTLLDDSRGIRSAVDVVIGYQQRSDSVLMRLLGKSYTLEDAAFYGAGVLAAMAAGVSPATAKAKLPVMALMGVSLLGERLLIDRLHMWLDLDGSDQLVVNLPLPAWLSLPLAALAPGPAAGGHWQLNLKWAVRRVALAVGAAMLLYSLATYRDYERESFKLLHELEEAQRRRHAEYVSLINSHKLELAAMLGGGGGQVPRAAQAPRLRAAAGAAAGDPGSHWQPDAQQERQQQQEVRRVQRVERETQLVVMDGGLLESVPEAEDEGESSGMHAPAATPAAKPAARPQPKAAAVTTPAAKAPKKGAAGARGPKSAMMQRVAAAAPAAGRKRGSSDGTEATDPSATTSWPKRRVGRGRRGTTEEGEAAPGAEGMALDEHPKEPRKRRGSTGQAAETKAAPKRARRG